MAHGAHRNGATRQRLFRKRARRSGFGVFFALSLILIAINTFDNPLLNSLRREAADLSAPLLATLSIPANYLRGFIGNLSELGDLRDQNRRLLEENKRLRDWRRLAQILEIENARLQELLDAEVVRPRSLVTARVIAVTGGPFVRSILINAGADQGVRKGLAVVDANGLVGQTVEVGDRASRILLLTDFNSRVPARVARSKDNGILIGRNEKLVDLEFLPVNRDVLAGDLVLTSGDGGLFPPGLLVGTVSMVTERKVRVRPVADLQSLEFVRILDFAARELEPPQAVAEDEGR